MQRPKDLSREQLEWVADEVQQALYLEYDAETDAFCWNPDKEWSGFDVCDALTGVLSQLGMVPEQQSPFS